MNGSSFSGRVALVTGSSRGIGSVIVQRFAEWGADVVINYRQEAGGPRLSKAQQVKDRIEALGPRALTVRCDISIKASVKAMMQQVKDHFGRLDFLILNAARAPFKAIENLLERELRQLVETNFLGQIYCIQEAVPLLSQSEGKIVFVSSLGSRFHNPAYPLGSMKAAMETVVRDCSESLRHRNIAVNAVCAGLVKNESLKLLRQHWDHLDRIPEHLFLQPEEVAEVILFLCSFASRGIRGQTIIVDKGLGNSLHCFADRP